MKKILISLLMLLPLANQLLAQNVGINNPSPAASALLDLTASDKGLLIPRLTTAQRTAIVAPATGLLVFDSSLLRFYYYDGTTWKSILNNSTGWTTTGNIGTNPTVNFLGTTDNQSLKFKVNNQQAGSIQTDGQTFIGLFAGLNNTGTSNSGFGNNALRANTTGIDNTAMGTNALFSNTTGSFNSAFGYYTLNSNTTGVANSSFGFNSLRTNTTGGNNCGFGEGTLYNNATGDNNTASGYRALWTNTTGYENTASGSLALTANTTGSENVAFGSYALYNNLPISNTTGNRNTAVGHSALKMNTSGSTNTALGYNAGLSGTTCTNNTYLGANTAITNGTSNSTAIGNNASVNASNKIRLGDANVTVIEGQVAYSYPSDARFKFNVKNNVPGLEFIMQLKPVTYNFDTKKFEEHLNQDMPDSIKANRMNNPDFTSSSNIIHSGFLAQDIEKACKQLNYDFDGLHIPDSNNKTDNYSVAYSQFIMPLVKGMQEQQTTITKQSEKISQQEKIINDLLSRIEKLETANK